MIIEDGFGFFDTNVIIDLYVIRVIFLGACINLKEAAVTVNRPTRLIQSELSPLQELRAVLPLTAYFLPIISSTNALDKKCSS